MSFPGLCVGGPMAGQLVEQKSPEFKVIDHGVRAFPDGLHFGVAEFTYIYEETPFGVHFWRPKDEPREKWLTSLALAYMAVCGTHP